MLLTQIGGKPMILLKKTEESCKTAGLEQAKKVYAAKIEQQIHDYDDRISVYERNLEKKNDLIARIEFAIAEYQKSGSSSKDSKENQMVEVLEKCRVNLKNDLKITRFKKASAILKSQNVSLADYDL